jgi:hypothetical protein
VKRTVSPRTWGLDLSTKPAKSAAVALVWEGDTASVDDVCQPLHATEIIERITATGEESWAVDVPFGWPDEFVDFMHDRHTQPLSGVLLPAPDSWETWRTTTLAQRRTDFFLTHHEGIRTRPLPASFQMLGATAAMWVLIEASLAARGVEIDRSGVDGRVCETYPRAALAAWGHRQPGKKDLDWLEAQFPFLKVDARWRSRLNNDDACDALVCALVARARELGHTYPPGEDALAAARREGWIHVSTRSSQELTSAPDPTQP